MTEILADRGGVRHDRGLPTVLLLLLVISTGLLSYRGLGGLGYCGIDTLVLIDIDPVRGPADLLRPFGREIRDGIEPSVRFYRPLTGVSFALDRALSGTAPGGYHRTDRFLHLVTALLLALLLRRLGLSRFAWGVAALWFVSHPLGVEVVPAPARRADLLAPLLLLAAALGMMHSDRKRRMGWLLWIVPGLLAPMAKETGFILPLVLLALPSRLGWRARLGAGFLLVMPALLLRSIVLQGAGGYGSWTLWWRALPTASLDLLDPFRGWGMWGSRGVALLALLMAAGLLWRGTRVQRRVLLFGAAWTLSMMLLNVFARGISPWYLYAPCVGVAAILASILDGGLGHGLDVEYRPRASELASRLVGWGRVAVVLLSMGILMAPAFSASPLWHRYPEWEEVTRQVRSWLVATPSLLQEDAGGQRGRDSSTPRLVAGLVRSVNLEPIPRFHVRAAAALGAISLQSALHLFEDADVEIKTVVGVRVHQLNARYRMIPGWERAADGSWRLRLTAEGPVSLVLPPPDLIPRAGIPRDHLATGSFEAELLDPRTVLISRLEAPLWLWDGDRLVEVEPPPDG